MVGMPMPEASVAAPRYSAVCGSSDSPDRCEPEVRRCRRFSSALLRPAGDACSTVPAQWYAFRQLIVGVDLAHVASTRRPLALKPSTCRGSAGRPDGRRRPSNRSRMSCLTRQHKRPVLECPSAQCAGCASFQVTLGGLGVRPAPRVTRYGLFQVRRCDVRMRVVTAAAMGGSFGWAVEPVMTSVTPWEDVATPIWKRWQARNKSVLGRTPDDASTHLTAIVILITIAVKCPSCAPHPRR